MNEVKYTVYSEYMGHWSEWEMPFRFDTKEEAIALAARLAKDSQNLYKAAKVETIITFL
jgi:hypothetical protein